MKTLWIFLWCLFCSLTYGQVGIGTTDPQAALDVSSTTNGGLLVPRYALSGNNDNSTVVNPSGMALVPGTLVYNTVAVTGANALDVGFVFWDGSGWDVVTPSTTGSGTSWDLSGNTITSSNFLGSTNFVPLALRTNNTEIGNLHPNGGFSIGIGASANENNSIALGRDAAASTNNEAIAIGSGATASGFQSSAIGVSATASNNSAIAIGNSSAASQLNSAAFGPTANASGQNATAIGWGSTAPNATTIILGNTDTNAANFTASKVGIGTDNPQAKLQVDGSFRYVDGNEAAGRVLTSDANGDATWAAPSATYGQIFKTSNTNGTNVSTAVQFGTNSISSGTTLNTSNIQTGSVTGLYRLTYTINIQRINGGNSNIEFFLTQGFGAANKITGSSSWASVRGGAIRASMTKTVLVDVNSTFQQFYVFPATTNANVRILPDSSLLIELVQAD